ncbi:MAG: APC family permease [Ancrocorticia sp.]|uniref:APC family permease n=1 Tax=Ancrocorticia sp. TaxID=2593684 RepID=UPI003F8DE3D4
MKTELERNLGVPGIVLMVVAAAAPITVVVANFPIILMESQNVGAPLVILAATIILLLFSAGYAWMTQHVPDAGAFYSYVDRGLGRRMGLGTAAIALLSYVLLTVSMTCYLGVQAGNLIELWTGIDLPWWLISAAAIAIVGALGYRQIDLSAKVLGVVLVLEVVAVLIVDIGVLASGRELSGKPFAPAEAFSGAPGLGLLFAFLGFFGFEATAVFRNEARDPERTVPRATYIAVLSIGILYTVSSWLVFSGLGVDSAVEQAEANPDGVIVGLTNDVVAPIMADIVQVLVVTSMFACMLSFHNIVARYLFTLGQRGVLPSALGEVHSAHGAPSKASLWVSGISAVMVAVSVAFRLDPVTQVYTWYSGVGAMGIIFMMALTGIAVVVFGMGLRKVGAGRSPSTAIIVFSSLGVVGLLGVLAITVWNFPVMVGGTIAAVICGAILVAVFVGGLFLPGSTASRKQTDHAPS